MVRESGAGKRDAERAADMDYQQQLKDIQKRIDKGDFAHGVAAESKMEPAPLVINPNYQGSGKLSGKTALISGADSGIGRAVAVHYAKEGANVAILYHEHDQDANETAEMCRKEGVDAVIVQFDQSQKDQCKTAVAEVKKALGKIDILVCNSAFQRPAKSIMDIDEEQLDQTMKVNVYGYFFLIQAALPEMSEGANIVCTTSVVSYHGQEMLIDYSATKGAITALIRALSKSLIEKGIRINGVAPGPVWTPFITNTFPKDAIKELGGGVPMGRISQPSEIAPSFVFLASEDATSFSGQVMHPNVMDYVGS